MHLAREKTWWELQSFYLEDRETPEEQAEYKALSKQMVYWQARYPFPFLEIKTWSQERQLNPTRDRPIRQESL